MNEAFCRGIFSMTTALSPLRGFVCDVTADPGTAVPGFIRLPLRGKFGDLR